ncbi:Uncharacterised protein [uncultured archaeon]|nr:Uncharacterised protein [uncultured archaeon]
MDEAQLPKKDKPAGGVAGRFLQAFDGFFKSAKEDGKPGPERKSEFMVSTREPAPAPGALPGFSPELESRITALRRINEAKTLQFLAEAEAEAREKVGPAPRTASPDNLLEISHEKKVWEATAKIAGGRIGELEREMKKP